MFGIGLPEMILILALALIVVGPDKLPELARSIAKGVLELKKTVSTLKEEFADENPFDSVKPELEEVANSLKDQLGEQTPDEWDGILANDELKLTEATDPSDSISPHIAADEHDSVTGPEAAENADTDDLPDHDQTGSPDSDHQPSPDPENDQESGAADRETLINKTAT